jgi:hypothetical protein
MASRTNENAPHVVAIHIVSVTLFLTNKWHLHSTAKLLTIKTANKLALKEYTRKGKIPNPPWTIGSNKIGSRLHSHPD